MFTANDYRSFEIFSTSHISMIVVFLVLISSSVITFRKMNSLNTQKIVQWILATILVLSEFTYQVWSFSVGIWEAQTFIPMQLCSFSTFFGIYLLFKKSKNMFYFFFYIAFFPPIFAIVTPDLIYDFPHYFFWKFFFQHMAISITALFLLYRDQWDLTVRSVFIAFLWLNAFALPIGIVNKIIGSNYFFLAGPPSSDTLLSFFASGWLYIVQLEMVALLFFFITYLIGRLLTKWHKT